MRVCLSQFACGLELVGRYRERGCSMLAEAWKRTRQSRRLVSRKRRLGVEELETRRLLTTAVLAEFPTPTSQSAPIGITTDSSGNLWFTESSNQGGKIGEFNPVTEAFTEYTLPTAIVLGQPEAIAIGPNDTVWFTAPGADVVGELDPATGDFTTFPLPAGANPSGISLGPDGNIWFTEPGISSIGSINPSTFALAQYITSGVHPLAITAAPDGLLWFTAPGAASIGSINPSTGSITVVPDIPTYDGGPLGITATSDSSGDTVIWLSQYKQGSIAYYTVPTSGPAALTEVTLTQGIADPTGIAVGPSGNVWFAGTVSTSTGGNTTTRAAVIEYSPTTQAFSWLFAPAANSQTLGIAFAPVQGASGTEDPWFTDEGAGQIGVVQFTSDYFTTIAVQPPGATEAGAPATFVATVGAGGFGEFSAGTVTFTVNGTPQGPVPLTPAAGGAQATFTTSNLLTGTNVITASYSGGSVNGSTLLPSQSSATSSLVIAASAPAYEAAVDNVVGTVLQNANTPGLSVAVYEDGSVVLAQGYGLANVATETPVTATTPFEIGSVTKTYTSLALLLLQDNPSLIQKPGITSFNINNPIGDYLSADPADDFTLPSTWAPITSEQLLYMTSGIHDESSNTLPWQQILERAANLPLDFTPGNLYEYSDTNFMLLGELIQQLTGVPYDQFLAANVLGPLGLAQTTVREDNWTPTGQATGYDSYDSASGTWLVPSLYRPGSSSNSSGAISTTAQDAGTYLEALMQGAILNPSTYAMMWTPMSLTVWNPPPTTATPGLGWDSITGSGADLMYAKNGGLPGFAAEYVLFPNQGIAVAVMANGVNAAVLGIAERIDSALLAAQAATTTSVVASPSAPTNDQPVTFTATVTPTGSSVPTGSVVFTIDGVAEPPVPIKVVGGVAQASFTASSLAAGSHTVVVTYSGDPNNAASVSTTTTVVVTQADGPRIVSVVWTGLNGRPRTVVLTFNEPLDAASAQDLDNYVLTLTGGPARARKRAIRLASATYSATAGTVTLLIRPRQALSLRLPIRLTVNGTSTTGVTDASGRLLDGEGAGKPGSDFTTLVTRANRQRLTPVKKRSR